MTVLAFVHGAVAMACAVAALRFVRFWQLTGDRLFVFFAAAFWLMGLNWQLLVFASRDEPQTALYAVRLVAFTLIIVGIWDKNRQASARKTSAGRP